MGSAGRCWPVADLSPRLAVTGALFAALWLSGCAAQSADDEQSEDTTTTIANHPALSAESVYVDDSKLHYRSIGTPKIAVAVWVHGTPGSWSDISRLMVDTPFTDQVRLVSVDRPGWGLSANNAATNKNFRWGDFATHSKLFGALLTRLRAAHPDVPIVVAGHSWGGSVVPTIAADHPNLVAGALVAAGGLDPEFAAPRWYNRLANTWLVNKLIGANLRHTNLEVYALQAQLSEQASRLADLPMPVLIVQGDDDMLVSPHHADFAERSFNPKNSRVVRLANQGHFLQMQRTPLIGRCIIALAINQLDDCKETPANEELR